jgi:hypothetical protein
MGSQEGKGSQTDKTPAAKSLRSIFLDNDIWHCIDAFYQSTLSTLQTNKSIFVSLLYMVCHNITKEAVLRNRITIYYGSDSDC